MCAKDRHEAHSDKRKRNCNIATSSTSTTLSAARNDDKNQFCSRSADKKRPDDNRHEITTRCDPLDKLAGYIDLAQDGRTHRRHIFRRRSQALFIVRIAFLQRSRLWD